MDPDANLQEQRALATRILRDLDADQPVDAVDAARLAELVLALDGWIASGGFLPCRWKKRKKS